MGLFASYPTPGRPQPLGGDLRLPRAPGLIRRFAAEHPRTVDTLVALVYLGVSITGSGSSASYDTPNSFAPGSAWQVNGFVPAIIMAIILFLFRRTQPWLILPIAFVADAALGPPLDFNISIVATLFALYALAVYRSIPQAWLGLVCAVIRSDCLRRRCRPGPTARFQYQYRCDTVCALCARGIPFNSTGLAGACLRCYRVFCKNLGVSPYQASHGHDV